MKNMKLFPKTFFHCLGLMLGVLLIAFFLIYRLLPGFYQAHQQRTVDADAGRLAARLQGEPSQKVSDLIASWALEKGYGYTAVCEDGELLGFAGVGVSFQAMGGGGGEMVFDLEQAEGRADFRIADGKRVILTLTLSLEPVKDALSVLLEILPVVLLLCLLLSSLIAYGYARSITEPIRDIIAATVRMGALEPEAACFPGRRDEIGVLSRNINEMYQKLLSAISDLERQIRTVSEAEKEKQDFLLLASHELKTPVTAVRGMIDGMLYQVGVYKDRDTYLLECQKGLEELSERICRILETSRFDLTTAAGNKERTDLGSLLEEVVSPYVILAQSRNIRIRFSGEEDFSEEIPADLIRKVFSNVLSNAVRYTGPGRSIRLYMKDHKVVVENECEPLSEVELAHLGEPFYRPARGEEPGGGSTGLGLYLIDRILTACRLSYSFAPYEEGMRFILDFGEERIF